MGGSLLSGFGILVSRLLLRLAGWTIESGAQPAGSYVLIGAPHTSKWDLPLAVLSVHALGLPVRWMAKHTLFRFPLGPALRALGGIPIERDRPNGVVDAATAALLGPSALVLFMAPEATRSRVTYWRSGFYHIAQQAGVPLRAMYLDYDRRTVGLGPPFQLTGDITVDMDGLRAFYEEHGGAKVPHRFAPPRLREEDGG